MNVSLLYAMCLHLATCAKDLITMRVSTCTYVVWPWHVTLSNHSLYIFSQNSVSETSSSICSTCSCDLYDAGTVKGLICILNDVDKALYKQRWCIGYTPRAFCCTLHQTDACLNIQDLQPCMMLKSPCLYHCLYDKKDVNSLVSAL